MGLCLRLQCLAAVSDGSCDMWRTVLTDAALSTIPAGLYLLFERLVLRGNTAIMGARCANLRPPDQLQS